MTTILNRKEYVGKDGLTYFVEKYKDKESNVAFWRYGTIVGGKAYLRSDQLWTRPNLKKLNLI